MKIELNFYTICMFYQMKCNIINQMKQLHSFYFQDHLMLITEKEPEKPHKHLASHLVLSLDCDMEWKVEGETIKCRGIYIDGNVEHVCFTKGHFVLFMFFKTSSWACSMEGSLLKGKPYALLDEKLVEKIRNIVNSLTDIKNPPEPKALDEQILKICNFSKNHERKYDSRIQEAINTVENLQTITEATIAQLAEDAFLSQSRFSHLFKEQTGMSLASWFAFEKLRKTYRYLLTGMNITDSCMLAGFDSPSHCAATCTKMFGISLGKIEGISDLVPQNKK